MLREDERDRAHREAAAHGALVEGVAIAVRAKWESVAEYAETWRTADWLDKEPAAPPAGPPPLNLLTTPYVQAAIRAATQAEESKPESPAKPAAPAAPIYRLRKARPGGS